MRAGTGALGVLVLLLVFASPAAADVITPTAASPALSEGQAFAGPLATFIDTPGGDTAANYSANIAWGDGASSSGTISGGDVTGWTVSAVPGHTYQEEGAYTITITITDAAAPTSATLTQHVTVADAPLSTPSQSPSSFSGTGGSGTAAALAVFEAAIGGVNNGTTPSPQTGGFRHVTWDDVTLDGSDPGSTVIKAGKAVAIARNREQAVGLALGQPLAVANDSFVSINPAVGSPLRFPPFSSTNVFAPFNTNVVQLGVVAPAGQGSTPTPRATRGIGLVFLNIRQSNSTSVEYMNGSAVLAKVFAPVGGLGQPSFVGVLFPSAVVTGVRITLGTTPIFYFDGTSFTAIAADSTENLVAADDVVQAEPTAVFPDIAATAGVQFTGKLDGFVDADASGTAGDYSAAIDWGDGTRTSGTVAANSSAGFDVSGAHSYAQAGSFPMVVTIDDLGGAQRTSSFTANVTGRSTATTLTCSPASVTVGQASTCTATVTDTAAGSASVPTGTVALRSSTPAGGFASGAGCTLAVNVVRGQSSCRSTYTPTGVAGGHHGITATYSGDAAHAVSGGSATIAVRSPGCSLKVVSTKLGGRSPKLRVVVRCDTRVGVRLTIAASIARKGKHKGARLTFGSASGSVSAAGTLSIKPSRKVLSALRSAAKNHQRMSLTLTLTATTSTRTTAKATVGSLKVS